MAKSLTDKQRKFVDEYLIDLNATQAAIRAGYSMKTAHSIGQENLKKPEIQRRLEQRQKSREKRTEITQDRVLTELAKIGFASITDYLEYKTALREIGKDENGEPIYDWAMLVNAHDSSAVDGAPIQEISIARDGTFKFKLYNKLDALEKMGRHLGLFDSASSLPANGNNLFDAIVGCTEDGLDTDEIPELEHEAESCDAVVELPDIQKP